MFRMEYFAAWLTAVVLAGGALPTEQGHQKHGGESGADELGHDVTGHATPLEVASEREGDADARIEMSPRDRAHGQDDHTDHRARGGHLGGQGEHVAAEFGVDHAAAHGDEDKEEGSEPFREQAAPLQPRVCEVEVSFVEPLIVP